MRYVITTLTAALLVAGVSVPAFAGGIASTHAGFAAMHAAAAQLDHSKHARPAGHGHLAHGHHRHHMRTR